MALSLRLALHRSGFPAQRRATDRHRIDIAKTEKFDPLWRINLQSTMQLANPPLP
jgi:hypothetical protein